MTVTSNLSLILFLNFLPAGPCFEELAEAEEFDVYDKYARDVLSPAASQHLEALLNRPEVGTSFCLGGGGGGIDRKKTKHMEAQHKKPQDKKPFFGGGGGGA